MATAMMRCLGVLAAMLPAVLSWASGPQATWLSTDHDFGAFDEDMGKVSCDFLLVNTGDSPLTIMSAHASCGCTAPRYSSEPISPGDTTAVTVTYNPFARPGKFDKKVKIKTNAGPEPDVLSIRGVVIGSANTLKAHYPVEAGSVKLKNSIITFGEVMKGRTQPAFLDGYNQSDDTIHPRISGLPPYIEVDIAPKAVPAGEQFVMTFFCNTSRCAADDWGLTSTVAEVYAEETPDARKDLELIVVLAEDFSSLSKEQVDRAPRMAVSTTVLDMGDLHPGEKAVKEIIVENFGTDALLIRKVAVTDSAIKAEVKKDKVKKGQQGKVVITVDPDKCSGDDNILNGRITLITNDPMRPQQPIRVTGALEK